MTYFFTGIIIYLLSGIIAAKFSKKFKVTTLSLLTFVASCLCLTPAVEVLISGNAFSQNFNFNNIFGIVNFSIDSLSAFFIVVITVMSLTSIIFSKGYLKEYFKSGENINSHLIFLTMLIASMLLVVTCHKHHNCRKQNNAIAHPYDNHTILCLLS